MASVTLVGIRKIYLGGGRSRVAVDGIDLAVGDGEFVVLVGPSGCGKSTTLRMVAGLESVSAGELRIGERVFNDVPAKDRNVAMVFQTYALYPHMTVFENMAFNLKLRRLAASEIDARVREAAAVLRIEPLLDRRPRQLSGGEQQRLALGRTLVRKPAVFLFDEPLSNLDAKLRVQMRREIAPPRHPPAATTPDGTRDQPVARPPGHSILRMHVGRRPRQVRGGSARAGGHGRPARLAPGARRGVAQPVEGEFRPEGLHLFDPVTRERLIPSPWPLAPSA